MKHLGLTASLLSLMACSSATSSLNKRTTGVINAADATGASQNAAPAADAAGSSTKLNNSALQALVSKYDDCTAAGKAWIPQTDSSKLASNPVGDCGADLVKFCCTLPRIQSLFSGSPDELGAHIQPLLDKKFQIYDCSQETADQVKVHLIKFDGAAVSYTDLTLSGLLASDSAPTAGGSCQKPDMGVLLQSTGEASPAAIAAANSGGSGADAGSGANAGSGSGADSGSGTAAGASAGAPTTSAGLTFAGDINPIVMASCGDSTCHGAGSAQKVFVGSEDTFKGDGAAIILQLNAGSMPAGGKTISAADKATLIKFLSP